MKLTEIETQKFARIIFNNPGNQKMEIDQLNEQQLEMIRSIYAQKIAYESVNGQIEPFFNDQVDEVHNGPRSPSLLSSVCCCYYPENNRDYFDLTTTVFLKRLFYPMLFWNDNFLAINDGKAEKYGVIWMIFTYSILLGFSSTLNSYFVEPQNFAYEFEVMTQAFGIVLIFKIAEPLIYGSVIGCLGGFIYSNQSMMLTSYSMILYVVPTLFCIVPSLYWHLLMMAIGCVMRAIFLFRNYATRLESKAYIILLVVFIIEALFLFVVLRTMFSKDLGYGFAEGFAGVFGVTPTLEEGAVVAGQEKKEHLYQNLRQFQV